MNVNLLNSAPFAPPGFIDFIVYPTFSLLTDMAEKIVIPLVEENPGPPDPCNRHRLHSWRFYRDPKKKKDPCGENDLFPGCWQQRGKSERRLVCIYFFSCGKKDTSSHLLKRYCFGFVTGLIEFAKTQTAILIKLLRLTVDLYQILLPLSRGVVF